MRLAILSRSSKLHSTRRLVEAARARGLKVRVLDPLDFELSLDGKQAHVFFRRKPLVGLDVAIPRIGASINNFGLAVVNQLGLTGITLVNSAQAIAQSRNKMRCLQLLSSHGVDIPATVMAEDARDLKEMVDIVGGVPVLVKLLGAGDRQGVMVCETTTSLEASLEAVLGLGQSLLVQQYVKDARGKDIRALVIGGQLVCAVRRTARSGRLYRTLGRAAFERVELSTAFEHAAVAAARLVGLEVAAVDLLDVAGRPKVFEVNHSPSLKELEEATGLDLAGAIVDHAVELVARARLPRKKRAPLPEPPPAVHLEPPRSAAEPRRSRKTAPSRRRRASAGRR